MSYHQFISRTRARLTAATRDTIDVPGLGTVEYADDGSGPPALVSHPLFGGFDVGLGVGRTFLGPTCRIVAPSRFGYLGSSLPPGATPADQADAFAAVLDAVGLERVVVLGYSAGGPPAIQFALRHPDRVSALVLLASALPGAAGSPPRLVAQLFFGSDLVFWLLGGIGPTTTARILGMDRHFRPTASQRKAISDTWTSLFPVSPRKRGVLHDLYVSNPDVQGYPLEQVAAPTLIINARDDAMSAFGNAEAAAGRLPHAQLVAVDHGGHLLLDNEAAVRRRITEFTAGRPAPVAAPEAVEIGSRAPFRKRGGRRS